MVMVRFLWRNFNSGFILLSPGTSCLLILLLLLRLYSHHLSRYVKEDVEKQWSVHKPENKDSINWAEYRENVYGFLDEENEVAHEEEHGFSYRKMEERDQRRWNLADLDHNGELSR